MPSPLPGRVAVTGGRTFFGAHVVERLVQNGEKVVLLEPIGNESGTRPVLDGVETIRFNLDEDAAEELVDLLKGVVAVIHLAPLATTVSIHADPDPYVRLQVPYATALFRALRVRRDELRRVIIGSSAAIYGEGSYYCGTCKGKRLPFFRAFRDMDSGAWNMDCNVCHRTLVPNPTSEGKEHRAVDVVGITLRDIEDLSMTFGRHYRIPVVGLRFFHLYGPGMPLDAESGELIASVYTCARAGTPPVIFEDGEQSRDFIYVLDAVAALNSAMYTKYISWTSLNIGSGRPTTVKGIARGLCLLAGFKGEPLIPGTYRRWDVRHLFADITKSSKVLSWEPEVSVDVGLRKFAEWASEQPEPDSACGAGTDFLEQEELIRPSAEGDK